MPGANFTGLDKGFKVAEAIKKYAPVIQTAHDTVEEADADTEYPIGIAQHAVETADAATGKAVVNVRMQGTTYAYATGVIANNGPVCVDGANPGRVKAAVAGDRIFAKNIGPASANNGDRIVLQLFIDTTGANVL
jgi:hypothetical protein